MNQLRGFWTILLFYLKKILWTYVSLTLGLTFFIHAQTCQLAGLLSFAHPTVIFLDLIQLKSSRFFCNVMWNLGPHILPSPTSDHPDFRQITRIVFKLYEKIQIKSIYSLNRFWLTKNLYTKPDPQKITFDPKTSLLTCYLIF